jgi:hypothetical protein
MSSKRALIPTASHNKPTQDDTTNKVATLLKQYPVKQLGTIWRMQAHAKICGECQFHLKIEESHELPSYELPDGLEAKDHCQLCEQSDDRTNTCESCNTSFCNKCKHTHSGLCDDIKLLRRCAVAGSPENIRRLIDTVTYCPEYDVPSLRPSHVYVQPQEKISKSLPHPPATAGKREPKTPKKAKPVYCREEIIGAGDSKYFLPRPHIEKTNDAS